MELNVQDSVIMKLRETESTSKLNVLDAQIKTRFSGNSRKFVGDFLKL